MTNRNIEFKSKQIVTYYANNRKSWLELYPSERWVFEKIAGENKSLGCVLDVGCACGGLGAALCEKFTFSSYVGIDIHKGSIAWAKEHARLPIPATFMAGDIVDQDQGGMFDVVVSLSCADWNIETNKIIESIVQISIVPLQTKHLLVLGLMGNLKLNSLQIHHPL